jgi:sigma-54 dependent transcriptional regulator, acetoin dehydrogenase operon transcriptional activator AcoR
MTHDDKVGFARECLMAKRLSEIQPEWIPPEVQNSWQRCLTAKLNPYSPPTVDPIPSAEIREIRARNARLYDIARMEVRNLYSQIAGSHFVVAFATKDAVILEAVADPSFDQVAKRSGIVVGSQWAENVRGTNALGSAAFTLVPTVIHAAEHFFHDNCNLTCVASPILDHENHLVGVIDASSDCHSRQIHTVALIRMSALHIESELFRDTFRGTVILQFHNRKEFVHTLEAGLVALSPDGKIIAANRQACFFLHDLPVTPGQSFDMIFSISYERFMAQAGVQNSGRLTDRRGSTYYVLASNLPRPGNTVPGIRSPERSTVATGKTQPQFVCEDPAVRQAIEIIENAVRWHVPILIRGETGTGKELLARHVHAVSKRPGKFVAVNCTALPETLIESEFFGYRGGAFTGGRREGARGLILEADQGTLFLDEIGHMPVALQARLLRFLDQFTVRAVGSSTEEKVDVQVVAATNCSLEEAVEKQQFRLDLLYRLRGIELTLPPLRKRSDFPLVVQSLLNALEPNCTISDEALRLLQQYHWPGNFRELKNLLLRMVIIANSPELLPLHVSRALSIPTASPQFEPTPPPPVDLKRSRRDFIVETYRRCDGSITRTARELAVSRNTIYRELRRIGIHKSKPDNSIEIASEV